MATETVTVRMSRSDAATSWGFRLEGGREFNAPLQISKVVPSSLADRAGLRDGDRLSQLLNRNAESMTHQEAQNTILGASNYLDLVVTRSAQPYGGGGIATPGIWRPTITTDLDRDTTVSKFQHTVYNPSSGAPAAPPPTPAGGPQPYGVRVSLEHQNKEVKVPGFNVTAQPFGDKQAISHLQYNSPMNVYSQNTAAEEYLKQTGGLFGTDPNLAKPKQEPSYLRSETLRLIQQTETTQSLQQTDPNQQSDSFKRISNALAVDETPSWVRSGSPGAAATPVGGGSGTVCDNCGRTIVGPFCSAGGQRQYHPDCFNCSTCGTNLKNSGYLMIKDKVYCHVHAAQQQKKDQFGPAPPVPPSAFMPRAPAPQRKHTDEPTKAFYQPEIMTKGPVLLPHISPAAPPPPKAMSPISPGARGVPTRPHMYGGSLTEKMESVTIQQTTAPPPPPPTMLGGVPPPPPMGGKLSPIGGGGPPPPPPQMGGALSPGGRPGGILSRAIDNVELTRGPSPRGRSEASGGYRPPTSAHDTFSPSRGRAILKQLNEAPRVPICESCHNDIRGPFILAVGKSWCPEHFVCNNRSCRRPLRDIGFVEERGATYCEFCYERDMAPRCAKCARAITGDCLNAMSRQWHPECFTCHHCQQTFGTASFYVEEGKPYCEKDWNALFTTKCQKCEFPIEAGDRWVEAMGSAFHSNCFTCTMCHKNLEGESFYAKGGKPFCKAHV